jgi:hypothetical protein
MRLEDSMLSFDIETTGLDPREAVVTCACACAPDAGVSATFLAGEEGVPLEPGRVMDLGEFFRLMDRAGTLCAFNGARFDVPFLQTVYGIDDARVGGWQLKLRDLYEGTYRAFGSAFSLNALLAANGAESKTGTGREAIALARLGEWRKLGDYCMQASFGVDWGVW